MYSKFKNFFLIVPFTIMWKNTVELGRPQMKWHMHILCWIP